MKARDGQEVTEPTAGDGIAHRWLEAFTAPYRKRSQECPARPLGAEPLRDPRPDDLDRRKASRRTPGHPQARVDQVPDAAGRPVCDWPETVPGVAEPLGRTQAYPCPHPSTPLQEREGGRAPIEPGLPQHDLFRKTHPRRTDQRIEPNPGCLLCRNAPFQGDFDGAL